MAVVKPSSVGRFSTILALANCFGFFDDSLIMGKQRTSSIFGNGAFLVSLAAWLMISPVAEAGKARGKLYSTAAVNRFCREAQQIIATTDLKAEVELFENITDFYGSDATPYRGEEELPLKNTGHIVYAMDDDGDEYVQGILCKMKSADGLNDAFPGLGAVKTNCSAVNGAFYAAVVKSLTNKEHEKITEVKFDTWEAYSGPQWTDDSGPPAPFAYTSTVDDKLHLVGKELYVNVDNELPPTIVPNEKKGVDYCQVPSAEYIRKLITGEITAPDCDAPPDFPQFPPTSIPTWDCQNP